MQKTSNGRRCAPIENPTIDLDNESNDNNINSFYVPECPVQTLQWKKGLPNSEYSSSWVRTVISQLIMRRYFNRPYISYPLPYSWQSLSRLYRKEYNHLLPSIPAVISARSKIQTGQC